MNMKYFLEFILLVTNVVYGYAQDNSNLHLYDEDNHSNFITTETENTLAAFFGTTTELTTEDNEITNNFQSIQKSPAFAVFFRNLDTSASSTESKLQETAEVVTTKDDITSSNTNSETSTSSSEAITISTPDMSTNAPPILSTSSATTTETDMSTNAPPILSTSSATTTETDMSTNAPPILSTSATTTETSSVTTESIDKGTITENPTTTTSAFESTDISSTTLSTTPAPNCEDYVKNVTLHIESFCIDIKWDPPENNAECNFMYQVIWGSDKSKNVSDTNFTITDLNACETYEITVNTLYQRRNVGNITNVVTTNTTAPKAVTIDIKNTTDNVIISWKPEPTTGKCIESYRIVVSYDNQTAIDTTLNINEIIVNDPKICAIHTYEIIPEPKGESNLITYDNNKVNEAPTFTGLKYEENTLTTMWNIGDQTCKVDYVSVTCTANNKDFYSNSTEVDGPLVSVNFSLDILEPATKYICSGAVVNLVGPSKSSPGSEIQTLPKAPDPPVNVEVHEITPGLHITWKNPTKWNGDPESVGVIIENLGLSYEQLKHCQDHSSKEPFTHSINDTTVIEWTFSNINASTNYKITVTATSNGGTTKSDYKEITTENQVPEEPIIEYQVISSEEKEFNGTVNLKITPPCVTNGKLEGFSFNIIGNRIDFPAHEITYNVSVSEMKIYYEYSLVDLKPDYTYVVAVSVLVIKHIGISASENFTMPAGIPKAQVTDSNWKAPVTDESDPTTAKVQFARNLFNNSMGDILYYAIIVAQAGCEEAPRSDYFKFWPSVRSNCNEISDAFQATPIKWRPVGKTDSIMFILGSDENKCVNDTQENCNRPLQSNTNYTVKIRGFTKSAFSDTGLRFFMTVGETINIGLIVGLVVGILAITSIIVIFLFYKNGSVNFKNWPKMKSVSEMSPAPLPIPIKKFDSHYRAMTVNAGRIKSEFQLLSTITSDVTYSTSSALLPINKKKNRYVNILPYDETRVKLTSTDSTSTDYINASFIKGYSGNIEYIATQGPTETTCLAFWEMVLERNVKLIVMLTQFVELGKEKCYRYFPDVKDELDFFNVITIECVEEQLLQVYNRRILKVTKNGTTKQVTHVQFNLWPDFGVPTKVHHMLDFCDIIKDIKMKNPSLTVMHCSAGVGRTGTLIAVDILLQAIKDKKKVDIFGTVLNLRKQRMNMVQSEKQYEFLYKCVHHIIMKKGDTESTQDSSSF